jgi:6-pyruvoyltetrahydropterin/6-carboxytetrahydropterin synthase
MAFEIKIIRYFSAAHSLRGYKGKCEELHGHNWKVEVLVSSPKLNSLGMVLDFKELKDKLNKVLSLLDHRYLNEIDFFKKFNPTSENIARYIFENLKKNKLNVKLEAVTVWESEDASATYKKR